MESRRFASLDIMRVMTMLVVLAVHSVSVDWVLDCGRAPLQDGLLASGGWFFQSGFFQGSQWLSRWLHTFAVPVFFALSGACYFLSEQRYGSLDALCWQKLRRLMLPCYAAGILYMIPLKYLAGFYTPVEAAAAMRAFLSGMNTYSYGHLWFLPALFWMFLFFYAGQQLFARRWWLQLAAAAGLCAVGYGRVQAWLGGDVFYLSFACEYFLWFVLGYGFWQQDYQQEKTERMCCFL